VSEWFAQLVVFFETQRLAEAANCGGLDARLLRHGSHGVQPDLFGILDHKSGGFL
jgi:hypothetical protein